VEIELKNLDARSNDFSCSMLLASATPASAYQTVRLTPVFWYRIDQFAAPANRAQRSTVQINQRIFRFEEVFRKTHAPRFTCDVRPNENSHIGLQPPDFTRKPLNLTAQAPPREVPMIEAIKNPTSEQLAIRAANRQRKRIQRAKEKARSDRAVLRYFDRLQAAKINADGIAWQQKRNLCTLGEIAPGVDAKTVDEALEVAREFARALGTPDVQDGESLLDFERRVFEAWVNYDKFVGRDDAGGNHPDAGGHAPYLNRETGELSPGHGRTYWIDHCGGFEKCWMPLPGAKVKIDIASLPKLRKLKQPEEPKPAPKPVPPTPTLVISPQNVAHFAWIPPRGHHYLNGG
jgi:hypothetical protein